MESLHIGNKLVKIINMIFNDLQIITSESNAVFHKWMLHAIHRLFAYAVSSLSMTSPCSKCAGFICLTAGLIAKVVVNGTCSFNFGLI